MGHRFAAAASSALLSLVAATARAQAVPALPPPAPATEMRSAPMFVVGLLGAIGGGVGIGVTVSAMNGPGCPRASSCTMSDVGATLGNDAWLTLSILLAAGGTAGAVYWGWPVSTNLPVAPRPSTKLPVAPRPSTKLPVAPRPSTATLLAPKVAVGPRSASATWSF